MLATLFWLAFILLTAYGLVRLFHWAWLQDRAERRNEQVLVGELEDWLREHK